MALQMAENRTELKLIGTRGATRALENDIDLAARSDARVLITGETGVGKGPHRPAHSPAQFAPARPTRHGQLRGADGYADRVELFGHTRGSFTDAYRDKPGILESAPNGTVFLDEVGEMSPRMQASLLRFLETGEIQRVGATSAMTCANVRIIAATNRDLHAAVTEGTFRQALFYRFDVIHIVVPPLRERREDIPALLEQFLECVRHTARRRARGPRTRSTFCRRTTGQATSVSFETPSSAWCCGRPVRGWRQTTSPSISR
jgi:transcriptional regulator with GAF, ATPase, and Fis domain